MKTEQLNIFGHIDKAGVIAVNNGTINRILPEDKKIHDWYRFVLSYPPHLVRHYIDEFQLNSGSVLLDPFCGTGTTLIEAKKRNVTAIGVEANPFAHFASLVKTNWEVDPDELMSFCREIASKARKELESQGIIDDFDCAAKIKDESLHTLNPKALDLLLKNSISPMPLHKALVLLGILNQHKSENLYNYSLLALAKTLVFKISNLRFGPEVGVGKPKQDVPVISNWLSEIYEICKDLKKTQPGNYSKVDVYFNDSRKLGSILPPRSIDAVITSPPYPNEKDYTRTTRLESVLLGFITEKSELRKFKKALIRSNTRGVYKEDDDDKYIQHFHEILKIADQIEKKRIELGKNSGFERMYAKVTKLYFGGMYCHFSELTKVLKPGAKLAYVVGDQASYLQVLIRTGKLLSELATDIGFRQIRTDLFRTRFATATKTQLREEVILLEWDGPVK